MSEKILSAPENWSYESPSLEVFEICTEGVLCSSLNGSSIDDAEEVEWQL